MNYDALIADLNRANTVASASAAQVDDGGTANLDSVFLRLPRAQEIKVLDSIRAAGLYCRAKRKWIGNGYMITPTAAGQGNKRAQAVNAMAKALKEAGYDVIVYHQTD